MQTQFEIDQAHKIANGNGHITRGNWNLIISRRDVSLFCKGMVPNRHWRLKHVKEYFGLKGNKESILAQLEEMIEDSHTQEDPNREEALEWFNSFSKGEQKEIVKEFEFDPPIKGEPKTKHIIGMYKIIFDIDQV